MRGKVAAAVGLSLLLSTPQLYALGLGEIELRSALNEPLSAEIQLVGVRAGELENAAVSLAPVEAFQQSGVERIGPLLDLNFEIVQREDGSAYIKVVSGQPIREPFLDFLVQVQWHSGRLLREYTLLLDPPVVSGERPAPVMAPAAVPAPVATEAEPVAVPETRAVEEARVPAPVSAAPAPSKSSSVARESSRMTAVRRTDTYGPTQRTDTLWSLASELRPDDSVSVYQAMLAIVKANPAAFYNNNVNQLKAGYVLRIPDRDMMAAIPQNEAVREVLGQYREWLQSKGLASAVAGGADAGGEPSNIAAGGTHADARLKLLTPQEKGAGAQGAGAAADLEKLRTELSLATESADTSKRENEELRARVKSLEAQIQSMQRLMTLKDEGLGAIQDKQAAAAQAPEVKPAGQQAAEQAVEPAQEATVEPRPPAEVQSKPEQAAKPKPQAPEETQEAGFFSSISNLALAGGVLLLLGALAWVVIRRRRAAASVPFASSDTELPGDVLAAEPFAGGDFKQEGEAPEPEAAKPARQDDFWQAEEAAEAASPVEGEIDPLVEVDVYLAYRRFQQAEALMKDAIARQPQRHELRVKLLEIYYAAHNNTAFEEYAKELFELLGHDANDPLWQRVVPMGRELLPGSSLFAPGSGGGAAASRVAAASAPAAAVMSAVEEEAPKVDVGGLDFNLDFGPPVEGGAESSDAVPPVVEQAVSSGEEAGQGGGFFASSEPGASDWDMQSNLSDFGNVDFGLDDTDLLAGTDVVGTKLDLAKAYIDMGDQQSAKEILGEVLTEGNDGQKQEAQTLMTQLA